MVIVNRRVASAVVAILALIGAIGGLAIYRLRSCPADEAAAHAVGFEDGDWPAGVDQVRVCYTRLTDDYLDYAAWVQVNGDPDSIIQVRERVAARWNVRETVQSCVAMRAPVAAPSWFGERRDLARERTCGVRGSDTHEAIWSADSMLMTMYVVPTSRDEWPFDTIGYVLTGGHTDCFEWTLNGQPFG